MPRTAVYSPETFQTFGELLHYLRRRARLTQLELGIAVGYSEAQISRLEQNKRQPDLTAVGALFLPALDLEEAPELAARLVELAAKARGESPVGMSVSMTKTVETLSDKVGSLEAVPPLPPYWVERPVILKKLSESVNKEPLVALCGLPGTGKTGLAARQAHEHAKDAPVFWLTLTQGITTSADAILRQVALFLLMNGQDQVTPLLSSEAQSNRPLPIDRQVNLVAGALNCLANSRPRPALLCLDNFENVLEDESVLRLLVHLAHVAQVRMLFTSRETVSSPGVTVLNLRGLSAEEGLVLVNQLAPQDVGQELVKRLLEKTNNPMLLRLALGQLAEESQGDPTRFIAHLERQPRVADYLIQSIQKRLSEPGTCLLSFLSVLRYPIDLQNELLVELSQAVDDPCEWARGIDELIRFQLIDTVERAVLHPLVRDFIYTNLSARIFLRKQWHHVAAEWYETGAGDVLEAAYQYLRAGELEQVAGVMEFHTEAIFASGQALTAAEILDDALSIIEKRRHVDPLPDSTTTDYSADQKGLRRTLLACRGDLLRSTARAEDAETSYRQALALAQESPVMLADITRRLVYLLMQRHKMQEALNLCQLARQQLPPANTILLARLLSLESRVLMTLTRFEEATQEAHQALELAESFSAYLPVVADEVRTRVYRTLGWISYTQSPQGDEALEYYQQALAAARRAGLRTLENAVLSNLAVALTEHGNAEGALQAYQSALESARLMGDLYTQGVIHHNMANLTNLQGNNIGTLQHLEEAYHLAVQVGDWEGILISGTGQGGVLLDMGRLEEARDVLERGLANAGEHGDVWGRGSALTTLAEVQALLGDISGAWETIHRLMCLPNIEQNARIYTNGCCAQAAIHLLSGEIDAARRLLDQPMPEKLGMEVGYKLTCLRSAAAYACHETEHAIALAGEVLRQAHEAGYDSFTKTAERLLKAYDEKVSPENALRALYFLA